MLLENDHRDSCIIQLYEHLHKLGANLPSDTITTIYADCLQARYKGKGIF